MTDAIKWTVPIKPRCGKRAKAGHPWIFSNEIQHPDSKPAPGILVRVIDDGGNFIGYATYNPHSLIALRILSRDEEEVPGTREWFEQRILKALALREQIFPGRKSCRLIYSDSDALPGVIVDRYESYLAVQIVTAGMERLSEPLIHALKSTLHPEGIILRNKNDKRKLEQLPAYDKTVYGVIPERCKFDEFGIRLVADIRGGQKTGYFFDQTENRLALIPFAKDREILDLFCHTGAWSMHLLKAGARHGIAVDSSRPAMELTRQNAQLNGVNDRLEFQQEDAFHWLSEARKAKRQFDLVVVDPPAFAKTGKQQGKALRGYEDLNRQAIHLIREEGILCTCSCSYFISMEQFLNTLQRAASREHKQLHILEIRGQSRDHPILLSMPESRYLKCVIGVVRPI